MNDGQKNYVLDTWAVIALIKDEEPAATRVQELIQAANNEQIYIALSVINLGEIYYIVGRSKGEDVAIEVLQELQEMAVDIHQISQDDVIRAAQFKMNHPISYADAFAMATASMLDATLVTGDPELMALSGLIDVEPLKRGQV